MDTILKKLDDLQDLLRDLEDFLEVQRDSEFVEFLSDYWKECLVGSVIAGFALYKVNSYLTVFKICLYYFFVLSFDFFSETTMLGQNQRKT